MWLEVTLPNYDRLQVVLSYDTDCSYWFHCLPWIITSSYMHKYVLKWTANKKYLQNKQSQSQVSNEFVVKKRYFSLYERQLYDLFSDIKEFGEATVFKDLTDHVSDTVHVYKLITWFSIKDWLFLNHWSVKLPLYEQMLADAQKQNHTLSLVETVRANTLLLLWYTPTNKLQ